MNDTQHFTPRFCGTECKYRHGSAKTFPRSCGWLIYHCEKSSFVRIIEYKMIRHISMLSLSINQFRSLVPLVLPAYLLTNCKFIKSYCGFFLDAATARFFTVGTPSLIVGSLLGGGEKYLNRVCAVAIVA